MKRLLGRDYRNPDRAPEHRHREYRDSSPPSVPRSRQPSSARLGFGGVPIFPNTPAGRAERLATTRLASSTTCRTRCMTTTTCSTAGRRQPSAGRAKHAPAAAAGRAPGLGKQRGRPSHERAAGQPLEGLEGHGARLLHDARREYGIIDQVIARR